ncbi:MAG TPA: hypothetical protein VLS93_10740 [Anaeromyxobacteraceae bacterium]|nr:hypothetical protein [Anaeromyxobacteraceae bacterium]
MKHQIATVLLALLFVAIALATGVHRRGAVAGASMAGLTAIASVIAVGRAALGPNPVRRSLAVLVAAFLLRLVLVGAGTFLLVRAGEGVAAFVVAFFVPYFVLAALEAAYVHSLRHRTGKAA